MPIPGLPGLRLPTTREESKSLLGGLQLPSGSDLISFFDTDAFQYSVLSQYTFPLPSRPVSHIASLASGFPLSFYPSLLVRWYRPVNASPLISFADGTDLYRAVLLVQLSFRAVFFQRHTAELSTLQTLISEAVHNAGSALVSFILS